MTGPDRWTIVVLAAGMGRRMGGPKALMSAAGTPWWRVQEARLAASGMPRLWVVSPEVDAAMTGGGISAVRGDPEAPMFDSVREGVRAAGSGVFVLPVDVPAPNAQVFAALSAAAGAGVAVPVYRGVRGHPLALAAPWIERVFRPACAGGRVTRLDQLSGPDAVEVPVDDPATVTNLNTPDDLARWLSVAG